MILNDGMQISRKNSKTSENHLMVFNEIPLTESTLGLPSCSGYFSGLREHFPRNFQSASNQILKKVGEKFFLLEKIPPQ